MSRNSHLARCSALSFAAALLACQSIWAGTPITFYGQPANLSVSPDLYHSQITTFYCGPASIEMQLDSNAWRTSLVAPYAGNIANPAIQNNIYAVSHANSGPGWFTDPNGLTFALNAATGNVGAFVQDDDATLNIANRNIANALEASGAPVSVLINHSAHWIDVFAVVTNAGAPPIVDTAYTIKGFWIRDPWPIAGSLGPRTFLADNSRAWGRYFNTAKPQAGAAWSGKYVSVTDPPVSDNGLFNSDPGPATPLPSPISSPTSAEGFAASDTANDSDMVGLEEPGGAFSIPDSTLMHFSDDAANAGDWLVPYEDASGVGGFELIDETTGLIDQATWFDAGSEIPFANMLTDVNDELTGNLIVDETPEPASLSLLAIGSGMMLVRRKKR